jgi:Ni/Fe-hydrogenase subunit HybB-like protein
VVLSCLHQSSLGTLMLIAPTKVHPLWFTPVMPALFLMSAMAVGFPMVIFESLIASRSFRHPPELPLLSGLARVAAVFVGLYGLAKVVDLTVREVWPQVWAFTPQSWAILAELVLGVAIPLLLFTLRRVRESALGLFLASTLVILGVALNRIDVFLIAYRPPFTQQVYTPSVFEIVLTVGLISTLVLVYRAVVFIFPVIASPHPSKEAR